MSNRACIICQSGPFLGHDVEPSAFPMDDSPLLKATQANLDRVNHIPARQMDMLRRKL